jgi:putative DNA primase/helicase
MTALDFALTYIGRKWAPVPVPYRKKKPILVDWGNLRITEADAPRFFNGAPQNIGVILGAASDGLADVDLDTPEAVAVAPYLLPPTKAIFGRPSNRASHWLFQSDLAQRHDTAVLEYRDPTLKPDAKPLVELRIGGGGKAAQTVFPGSVHESGEAINWEERGNPAEVTGDVLEGAVKQVAAAALLARHWPGEGSRHEAAKAVGGMLAHGGWSLPATKLFVQALARAAGDPEWKDRETAARDAVNKREQGDKVLGLPTLVTLMDERAAKRAAEWLGLVTVDSFGFTKRTSSADRASTATGTATNDILTEDNAAQRFAELYAGRLRFCHDRGAWFEWNGTIWKQNRTGTAFQWARELPRQISRTEKERIRYVSSKTSFAAGVERFARSDPVFAVTIDIWDPDPWLLGTPGGTVDLRTGELRAADPADCITRNCAVAPTEEADCPIWVRFLREATGGDEELIRFVQQWCGYGLTGSTREHALVFVYGPGGNGKTVFINVLTGIMADYGTTSAMETFTASMSDRHPTDLAMLRGARLVTASETEEGRAWAETRIKALTGGDLISARFMRQDFFTYRPQFKLTVIGNHKPVLRNVDEAARRRFNIVPFIHKPVNPDPQLEDKLRGEWPSILRWMIDGCLDWQKNRLVRPQSVDAATAEYFSAQDLFGQWLDEACDVEPANEWLSAKTGDLYGSWATFAKASGEDPRSKRSFSTELQKRGLVPNKGTGGVRIFRGITLKPPPTKSSADSNDA